MLVQLTRCDEKRVSTFDGKGEASTEGLFSLKTRRQTVAGQRRRLEAKQRERKKRTFVPTRMRHLAGFIPTRKK